ncbi:MAG: LytTR family transcriptional regulator [Lachnospiraceae bacterium]|nr:LytTR family transcriptional regulator [Lachnospiraceae bacterium]
MNNFKVKIEIDEQLNESEVVIRCGKVDEDVLKLQSLISSATSQKEQIVFYKEDTEFFLPLDNVLFFETDSGCIRAHTIDDEFDVKYKLYELEDRLPRTFIRVSKSAILNVKKVYSITRNLTGASKVEFQHSHKIVYCSRNYYKSLKDSLTV